MARKSTQKKPTAKQKQPAKGSNQAQKKTAEKLNNKQTKQSPRTTSKQSSKVVKGRQVVNSTSTTVKTNKNTSSKQGPKQAKIEIIKPSNKAGQPRNEFRDYKKSGHPSYVFRKYKRYYDFIGLTHAEETKGEKNIKLSKNPNPKEKKTSYLRPYPKRGRTAHFDNEIKKGWKFAAEDTEKVNEVKSKPIKKEK